MSMLGVFIGVQSILEVFIGVQSILGVFIGVQSILGVFIGVQSILGVFIGRAYLMQLMDRCCGILPNGRADRLDSTTQWASG